MAPVTNTPDSTNDRLLAATEAYDRDDAGPAERAEFLAAREAAAPVAETSIRDRAHAILTARGIDPIAASGDVWSDAVAEARAEVAPRTNHTPPDMSSRIFAWLDALEANYRLRGYDNGIRFEQSPPRGKYSRIVQCDADGSARSVHAFLDVRTGDIFKPAGWKAPAKHVRFNLLDDASFARLISTCDWSGRYLYLR